MNWIRHLEYCFLSFFSIKIPKQILGNEPLIRGISQPFSYSITKSSLKRESFLPPPDEDEVSVLRLNYTDEIFCKNDLMNLNGYCGMAMIQVNYVVETGMTQSLTMDVIASPLDLEKKPIDFPVFKMTPGVPMHADIKYPFKMTKGDLQTRFRLYANELIKRAVYQHDESPLDKGWKGERFLVKNQ